MRTAMIPFTANTPVALALRLSTWLAGGLLLVWAVVAPTFRDAEGFPSGSVCLPIAAGIALLLLGWGLGSRLASFSFWFALALVGQAVALQLVDAGPLLRYQHYRPLDRLLEGANPLYAAYLALQATILLVSLKSHWPRMRAWIAGNFRPWQLAAVFLLFFLPGAAVQRSIPLYVGDLLVAAIVQSTNLGTVVLAVLSLPEETLLSWREHIERILGRGGEKGVEESTGGDRLVLAAGAWVAALATVLALLAYQGHPHITDEVAYLYQARFFAEGTLTLPAPPVTEAFDIYLMETKGDLWYPATPPGWPAMLALGARFGVPWLVNPLLAGLNLLLTYLLLRELYDRWAARLAVLLLCASPWYVFMAMNYMNHTFTLTCALVAAVGVAWARRTGRARWAWLAGGAVGMGSLIRPMDGLIVGVLVGAWAIGIGGARLKLSSIVALALGTALVGGMVFPFNQALTGSPMVFPLNAYLDSHFGPGRNDLGFGPNRGYGWPLQPFPGHSPLGALINADLNSSSINTELFGWSIGSLLFVALMLFKGSLRKNDWLMIAVCLAVFWPYFFYYYSGGPDFGARYWYLMIIPLVALTVRGIRFLQERFEAGTAGRAAHGTRVLVAVLALSLLTLVNYFPWRALDKYHDFWGMRPDVVSLAREYSFGKSLVLIRGPESHPDFASAAIYNPLRWDADAPVYAWDRDPELRERLLKAFPDRPVWIVDAPSVTHRGYAVAAGPLSATALLPQQNVGGTALP